jgi:5,10-methylenetetrahydromethanopterin reductase
MKLATVCLWRDDPDAFVTEVQDADALGYEMICVGDSQSVYREVYVSLAVAALHSSRARLGPMVTNPITRHPAVTASAIATIDELSGGRAIMGIGTGDSAVRNLRHRPATLAELERYVTAVQRLTRGEDIEYDGVSVHTRWASRPVPVYVTAEGPKTIRMAGRVADGVVLHTGTDPVIIADSLRLLHEGAAEAGRDPDDIDVWLFLKAGIGDTHEEAVDGIKMGLAGSAHHAFRFTLEGKHVPDALAPAVKELVHRYETQAHEVWDGANRHLTDELGLTDYLADRFGVIGTPNECIERLRAVQAAGIDNVLIAALGPDPLGVVRRFGHDVMPAIDG